MPRVLNDSRASQPDKLTRRLSSMECPARPCKPVKATKRCGRYHLNLSWQSNENTVKEGNTASKPSKPSNVFKLHWSTFSTKCVSAGSGAIPSAKPCRLVRPARPKYSSQMVMACRRTKLRPKPAKLVTSGQPPQSSFRHLSRGGRSPNKIWRSVSERPASWQFSHKSSRNAFGNAAANCLPFNLLPRSVLLRLRWRRCCEDPGKACMKGSMSLPSSQALFQPAAANRPAKVLFRASYLGWRSGGSALRSLEPTIAFKMWHRSASTDAAAVSTLVDIASVIICMGKRLSRRLFIMAMCAGCLALRTSTSAKPSVIPTGRSPSPPPMV
mmetsp:Transcript_61844/g.180752  ORF Transcript_61844/g.180752 Transcript_61844/m.180752 type:complete len:327 (+) Transcript_61844:576-1556(+)